MPALVRNGLPEHTLGNTLNVEFQDTAGEALVQALDLDGIAVSMGAACHSGSVDPSHVLSAMGRTPAQARGLAALQHGARARRGTDRPRDRPRRDARRARALGRARRVSSTVGVDAGERERVIVAMSGGVDSSVAAAIVAAEDVEAIGVTLHLAGSASRCCSLDDVDDARRVAEGPRAALLRREPEGRVPARDHGTLRRRVPAR